MGFADVLYINSPCQGCPDRNPPCWGGCEKYQNYKTELERIKNKARKDTFSNRINYEGCQASIKRRGGQR